MEISTQPPLCVSKRRLFYIISTYSLCGRRTDGWPSSSAPELKQAQIPGVADEVRLGRRNLVDQKSNTSPLPDASAQVNLGNHPTKCRGPVRRSPGIEGRLCRTGRRRLSPHRVESLSGQLCDEGFVRAGRPWPGECLGGVGVDDGVLDRQRRCRVQSILGGLYSSMDLSRIKSDSELPR